MILSYKEVLCLSGWGQKFDSLEHVFSESFFLSKFRVKSIDYSLLKSAEEFFWEIDGRKINPEILIGWSLGGQLAIRLIERKILQPKLLILVAPPFQMIKDSHIQAGMSQKTFDDFYRNFATIPTQALRQFAILTSMNDRNAKEIVSTLDISERNFEQLKFWLSELERFSCFDVNFSEMPRTLYFHGAGDMIVHVSQAEYFRERIKNFRLEIFNKCGHAPHLSDPKRFRKIIYEEIENEFL